MAGPFTKIGSLSNINTTQDLTYAGALAQCHAVADFVVDLIGSGVQSWVVTFKKTLDSGQTLTLATVTISGAGPVHVPLVSPFTTPEVPTPEPDTITFTHVLGTASFDVYQLYGD